MGKKDSSTEQRVEACAETLKMNLPSVHFLFCTLVAFFNAVAEKDTAACLNSGVCYAVDLEGNGDRSAFCYCVEKETRSRCEQFLYTGQVLTADAASEYRIATIVVLALNGLILVAVLLMVLVRRKFKTEKKTIL